MLGFAIFDRGPRGLEKTAQGSVVVHGAALLLRELLHVQAEAEATGAAGDLAAVLRLGTSAFLAVGLLPPVIGRLSRLTPPMAVRLREDNVPQLFEALLAGELNALVTLYNPDVMASTVGRAVRFERLSDEPYVLIAPPDHRLARARARAPDWQALAEERWVLTRRPSLARVLLEDSFRRNGAYLPEPLCETDGPVTAEHLVAEGVGISSVPESTARAHGQRCRQGREVQVSTADRHLGIGVPRCVCGTSETDAASNRVETLIPVAIAAYAVARLRHAVRMAACGVSGFSLRPR